MKKRVLLQTAVLLAATVNLSYVAASCFPPAKGQTPLDVLECLQSELDSQQKRIAELEKENERLRKKTGCPAGMANARGYCIHTISPYPRGKNWWQALDACIADGYRLCSQSEVVNALRAGVLKQYYWSEGNSWYRTASQAETSPGAGGENQVCDVQGNIDEPNHPQYNVQCNHEKSWADKWSTTVCCY